MQASDRLLLPKERCLRTYLLPFRYPRVGDVGFDWWGLICRVFYIELNKDACDSTYPGVEGSLMVHHAALVGAACSRETARRFNGVPASWFSSHRGLHVVEMAVGRALVYQAGSVDLRF